MFGISPEPDKWEIERTEIAMNHKLGKSFVKSGIYPTNYGLKISQFGVLVSLQRLTYLIFKAFFLPLDP